MMIAADSILCIVLTCIGYAAVCFYYNTEKWKQRDFSVLKLSKNKIIFLCVAIVTSAVLIVLFNTLYDRNLITQIKLLSLLLVILPNAAVDYRSQKMPNQFMLAGLGIRMILFIVEACIDFQGFLSMALDAFIGAAVIGVFFFLLLLIFKNSIGMGDVKMFALMGLYQGLWGAVNSVFFSLLTCFLISIILLITKRKKRKDTISFGPSIFIGTFIAMCLSGM